MLDRTLQQQQRRSCSVLDHPPYRPGLAPFDYHLFYHIKRWLGGQHFETNNEMQTSVENWMIAQAAAFYDEGI